MLQRQEGPSSTLSVSAAPWRLNLQSSHSSNLRDMLSVLSEVNAGWPATTLSLPKVSVICLAGSSSPTQLAWNGRLSCWDLSEEAWLLSSATISLCLVDWITGIKLKSVVGAGGGWGDFEVFFISCFCVYSADWNNNRTVHLFLETLISFISDCPSVVLAPVRRSLQISAPR